MTPDLTHVLKSIALVSIIVLMVVWVMYPALMGMLASARPAARYPEAGPDVRVSVVLATREASDVIRARVANLLETAFPLNRLELIVVLDARDSRATPKDLADLGPLVQVIVGDEPGGKAMGVNAGMRLATGEVVVFADSFQTFTADTIPRLAGALQTPGTGAVSGRLVLAPAEDNVSPIHLYWAYETWIRQCEARWHSCVGVFGPVNAIRRELWAPLRSGLILDDVYTPMRLVLEGYRIRFVQQALAIDIRNSSPDSEYRRKVRTLTGNIQLCLWLPSVLNPLRNPLWLQFVCHKLGRLLTPYAVFAVGISGIALLIDRLSRTPNLIPLLLLFLIAVLSSAALRQSVGRLGAWIVGMQAAVVVATMNGVRGRWNVWTR